MKKIIIGLCVIIVIQALCIVYMNSTIGQNTKHIEALEQYTKAQIYKKDAQLYLMNSQWTTQKFISYWPTLVKWIVLTIKTVNNHG